MKHRYQVRPGHGSGSPLIELDGTATPEGDLLETLYLALVPCGISLRERTNLWMNDEVRLHFDSEGGPFDLSVDPRGLVLIRADEHPEAIAYVDRRLTESGQFERVEAEPPDRR